METITEPIQRLRELASNQAKSERAELFTAFREAIADDVSLTENQQEQLESTIAGHHRWLAENSPRLEALLPRTLASLSTFEMKRDLYRNQIASVLTEAKQISANSLWGRRSDGQRDPAAFGAVVSGVKNRLGQARGLAGALHRVFLQIEIELLAMEKRGLGLPPEPVPLMEPPPAPSTEAPTSNTKFNPRAKK